MNANELIVLLQSHTTPAEQLGYKVGDRFVTEGVCDLGAGRIVSLYEDDGSDCLMFKIEDGLGGKYNNCDGQPGQYIRIDRVKPLKESQK